MEFESGTVDAPNITLHYDILGEGRPLLMLAGGPGCSPDYLFSTAAALRDNAKCIILHQRGTGRSILENPDSHTVNVGTYVDDINLLLMHLKRASVSIFGHSWGAMLAMAYASVYPERVDKLILACSGGMDGTFWSYAFDNIQSYLTTSEIEALGYWSHPDQSGNPEARKNLFDAIAPAVVFDRTLAPKASAILATIDPSIESLILQSTLSKDYDVREAMSKFDKPVTLIHVRQDHLGEGIAYQAAATFPHPKLIWIERCGHFPHLDQPDIFNNAVRLGLT